MCYLLVVVYSVIFEKHTVFSQNRNKTDYFLVPRSSRLQRFWCLCSVHQRVMCFLWSPKENTSHFWQNYLILSSCKNKLTIISATCESLEVLSKFKVFFILSTTCFSYQHTAVSTIKRRNLFTTLNVFYVSGVEKCFEKFFPLLVAAFYNIVINKESKYRHLFYLLVNMEGKLYGFIYHQSFCFDGQFSLWHRDLLLWLILSY